MVFGKVKTFSVKIEVTNKGEDAFLSKMNVAFSNDFKAAGVDFVNVSLQCFCYHLYSMFEFHFGICSINIFVYMPYFSKGLLPCKILNLCTM